MNFEDYYIPEPNSGCWIWTAGSDPKGYGRYRRDGQQLAHRYSYQCSNPDDDMDGLVVMHKCDVPACVNPDHLRLGTIADNNRDAFAKGRRGGPNAGSFCGGETHPNAVLTADIVRWIRSCGKSRRELATILGMKYQTISDAQAGRTWSDI